MMQPTKNLMLPQTPMQAVCVAKETARANERQRESCRAKS